MAEHGRAWQGRAWHARRVQTRQWPVRTQGSENAIPLPNVAGAVLARVLEFLTVHAVHAAETVPSKTADELAAFDTTFFDVDRDTLFNVIMVRPKSGKSGKSGKSADC
jgi:S-phase kinase-associated protein 1